MQEDIVRLQNQTQSLTDLKQDKSSFLEQRKELQDQIEAVNRHFDDTSSGLRNVENFVDKYIPIRI